jgi:hypothetical protein
MRNALKMILEGFDDDPRRAMRDVIFVAVLLTLLIGFCAWYAVPVPTTIPEYPVIAEAAKRVVGR